MAGGKAVKTMNVVLARIILVNALLLGFAVWMSLPKTETVTVQIVETIEVKPIKPRRPTKVAKAHKLDPRGSDLTPEPVAMSQSRNPAERRALQASTTPFIPIMPRTGTSVPLF